MHDGAEGLSRIAEQQNIHFDEITGAEAERLVAHRGVAGGRGLQLIEEIQHDPLQRHFEGEQRAVSIEVFESFVDAAAVLHERHRGADVDLATDDLELHPGLTDFGDVGRIRKVGRVAEVGDVGLVELDQARADNRRRLFGLQFYLVEHAWSRNDQIAVVFALQTLLNDVQVQKAEEAAAEAIAERGVVLRNHLQSGVIE